MLRPQGERGGQTAGSGHSCATAAAASEDTSWNGQRGRPRTVPLWWDAGTLKDISAWKIDRVERGAACESLFIGLLQPGREGTPLSRHTLQKRFRTACKVLGQERLRTLPIHHGRPTFISHALAGGRTLAEVRDAAGHANVSITSRYLHIAVDDQTVGQLFAASPTCPS
ncbi:MAG: tyrosine-type recombinase/integrase [Pirellulales bacterium]